MDNVKKFEDFLDRMQGLLDNAKKQGHIIVRVEDLERTFPELREEDSKEKPNGGIVMEDFNEGNGFYKVNLNYLNKEQVEEIEGLVKKWNPELKENKDERIRKALLEMVHDTTGDSLWVDYNVHKEDAIAWIEKQGGHANFLSKIQVGDKVTRNEDGVLVNLSQLKRIAKPAEEHNITGIGSKNAQGKLGEMIKNLKNDNEVLEQKSADEEMKEALRTEYEKGRADVIAEIQKPAWSEEDEEFLSEIISDIKFAQDKHPDSQMNQIIFEEEVTWLKSLKERIGG